MIKWCKRVPQHLISRLYNQIAKGIQDDDLLDDVGYTLYSRCESIVSATYGFEKKCLKCQNCSEEILLTDNEFNCSCGFNVTWDEFKKSYKGKQLHAANALPIFLKYIETFPKAKTYGEKIICIDILIHSFHIKMSYYKTLDSYDPENETVELNRPTAANLIEGSLSEVILFLDKLSGINEYSQEKIRWRKIVERANGGKILSKKIL